MSREAGDGSIGQPAALAPGAGGGGNWPREGSRETKEGKIISVPDDWCKSGGTPVPYPIWAFQKDASHLAYTVRQTDDCSHVKGSQIERCYGDEGADDHGGVKSHTKGGICEPKTWSETVRAEGRNMVRHDDEWWMNNRNTWGRLVYTKDMGAYSTAAVENIPPKMQLASASSDLPMSMTRSNSSTSSAGAGLGSGSAGGGAVMEAFAGPMVEPMLKPGPMIEPPLPFPMPLPNPGPGLRNSRDCMAITICFDRKGYNEAEYKRQLALQAAAINAKSADQNCADISNYNENYAKKGRRAAEDYNEDEPPLPGTEHPSGNAAIHRLDMVAGGRFDDFAGYGDKNINSSIGASWRGSRVECLKDYACAYKGRCPMAVFLELCGSGCTIAPFA